ncbi:MAG: ROK family protein [Candidatus Nanoarchaeia archaeon]
MKKEVIAIDLGGTHFRIAIVRNGKLRGYEKHETPKSKSEILRLLDKEIKKHVDKNTKGVGVSVAGGIYNGVIELSPNLPLKGFNIKKFIEKSCKRKIKVVVENDANCFALGEAVYGVKKKNFFTLTFGTGIGGGIIIDGKLYVGRGNAGELGHIMLSRGRDFEHYAGQKALIKLIKKYYNVKTVNEKVIVKILYSKDSKAKKIRNELTDYYGQGIASLINILDPEVVVLGGGMSNLGKPFLNQIIKATRKHSFLQKLPPIQWSRLKNAGILGAGELVGN